MMSAPPKARPNKRWVKFAREVLDKHTAAVNRVFTATGTNRSTFLMHLEDVWAENKHIPHDEAIAQAQLRILAEQQTQPKRW